MVLLVIIGILGVITLLFLVGGAALCLFNAIFGYDKLADDEHITELDAKLRKRLRDDIAAADAFDARYGGEHQSIHYTDARSVHYHDNRYSDDGYDDGYGGGSDRYINY